MENFLIHTADVEAEAPAGTSAGQTGMGGVDRTTWIPVESNLPCLFRPRSVNNVATDDRAQQQILAKVYFTSDPVATGLTSKHRLIIRGCPRQADNGTYSVIGARDINALGRVLEVEVERVRGE
jgi:hypothetical protein